MFTLLSNIAESGLSSWLLVLDNWADRTIKGSILGRLVRKPDRDVACDRDVSCNVSTILLFLSITILFSSLSLPQFANDRFGIGIIVLICFFIFVINSIVNKFSFEFNFIDFLLLLLICVSLVSTFSSYFLKESLMGLFKCFVFLIWYFVAKFTLQNSSNKVFTNLWIIVTITALIGIYQYVIGVEPLATWEDPNAETTYTRVYSTLGNPNLLAGYLIPILPIAIVLQFKNKLGWLFKIFSSAVILICLIFTGSRGAYLGLIVGFIFSVFVLLNYLINKVKEKNKTVLFFGLFFCFIVVIVGISFLFPVVFERISTIFTLREHSSNSYRVNVWLACLQMLRDNWLIGIGPGNNTFRLAYGLYMISGFDALAAYNIFLEFAIEFGVFGCILFVLIVLISFLKLHYLFWMKGNIYALGIFISLISLLTHGMFDTVFFRPQVFILFWFLLSSVDKIDKMGKIDKIESEAKKN